ncbi:MAG: amidohydrolase [Chromatiales bacterium]|nr:amidohydrolase [Chromatiales bacterium]
MSQIEGLKKRVCDAIEARADEIIDIGETILRNPETGFREFETAALVADKMRELGLEPQTGLARTGVKARFRGSNAGPTLAIIGELDSLRIPDHPFANPQTGAAHACGHNAQVAGMLGAAMGLLGSGVAKEIGGDLAFVAVPAEEMIEVGFRMQLREQGEIEFLTGKAEFIRLGHFDDVDLAMMCHTKNDKIASHMANSSNGAVIKKIRFLGKAAHAGSSPQKGINALNAANLAMTAIALQRETFYDGDTIRIHPIITKGGDAVSAVPAEVVMETFVRGRTLEGIVDANRKVDRALRGAAMAIGAEVEIETTAGYLPQNNNPRMGALWGDNVRAIYGEGQFYAEEHRTGSTDMGDLGHIMPVIHPYIFGATGVGHGNDYLLPGKRDVYVNMAKLLAMTAVDLLVDDASVAREVLEAQRPKLSKPEYLAFNRKLNGTERYRVEPD